MRNNTEPKYLKNQKVRLKYGFKYIYMYIIYKCYLQTGIYQLL